MKTSLRLTIAAFGLTIFNLSVQAEDFIFTTNNGTITITDYTGPGIVSPLMNSCRHYLTAPPQNGAKATRSHTKQNRNSSNFGGIIYYRKPRCWKK